MSFKGNVYKEYNTDPIWTPVELPKIQRTGMSAGNIDELCTI